MPSYIARFEFFCKRRPRKNAMTEPDIPALIKELRERLGLTQEQFAQRVGVTYSTVNHWENGKRTPQPFLLRRLQELKEELDRDQRRKR
jgi:transcriptional regulator with XRE-family HTH domain